MKNNSFLETMAEWGYALKHFGTDLPWQTIIINHDNSQTVIINDIIKLDIGLKLVTDNDDIIISPEHNWRLKHGRTALKKTIFTHDLSA